MVSVVYYTDKDASGKPINPIRFVGGTAEDKLNLDYVVKWNGLKAGTENTYTVTITGNGRTADRYMLDTESSVTKEYRVFDKSDKNVIDLSKAKVTLDDRAKGAFYTGHGITPEVTEVKVGKETIDAGKYEVSYKSNVNAGTAAVIISADSSAEYKEGESFVIGSKSVTFNINKAAFNKGQVTVVAKDQNNKDFGSVPYPYRGMEAVELCDSYSYVETSEGVLLEEGIDYEVIYKNNHKAGKAVVTIKGIGSNIAGSWSKQFTIEALDFNDYTLALTDESLQYSPKGAKLGYIVARKGNDEIWLKEGVDFKVSYKYDDKKTKRFDTSVAFTAKGMNACKGVYSGDGKIKKAYFEDTVLVTGDIIVDATKAVPTGAKLQKALEKATAVTDLYGAKLKAKKEYQLESKVIDGRNVVVISPAAAVAENYHSDFGTLEREYYTPKNIAKLKTAAFAKGFVKYYDGRNPVELDEDDIKLLGFELGTDVELVEGSYKNNCKKGSATVTIRGIGTNGKYYGTKKIKFQVKEA